MPVQNGAIPARFGESAGGAARGSVSLRETLRPADGEAVRRTF